MRAASVLGVEAGALWKTIIPIQIFGIVLCFVHAVLAGIQEKKRGAGLHGKLALEDVAEETDDEIKVNEENELAMPNLFVFNILLTVAVIALLVWDQLPNYVPFIKLVKEYSDLF